MKVSVIILLVALLISCNQELKNAVNKTGNDFSGANIKENESDTNHTLPKVIDGEKLSEFLPDGISGCEKSPFKIGEIDEGNRKSIVVSCEYSYPNQGFLKFSIIDYGAYKYIPEFEINLINKPPVESGKLVEEIIISKGKGIVIWDDVQREGSLFALVLDRFIFRIDGTLLPASAMKLQDYLQYFKMKKFIDSIKEQK